MSRNQTQTRIQALIKPIGTALAAVVPNTYHYWRPQMDPPYLIWQEDYSRNLRADMTAAEIGIQGTADYYTRTEYDPATDLIQGVFDDLHLWWRLVSTDYEEETGLIHHSWDWGAV